ncbi:hypothetical protein J3E74DRAFT_453794 [Bipolaris maydis]|nr:hypothetical protein J3E74DRAFT_453794 [Bipolaris maydis]
MASFARFLYSQLFITPPPPKADLTGKIVLITGSNTGLGKEAARHYVSLNASTVILAVRSLEKGEAAAKDIETTTSRQNVIKVLHLDMSSYQSVLDFASTVSKEVDRLDIAILNAGVNRGVWELFEQDESTITVNVVSTFLLFFSLLPKLRDTANKFNVRPTLTVVSSLMHQWTGFAERKAPEGQLFERLREEVVQGKKVDLMDRYSVSKLMEVLVVREFCGRNQTGDGKRGMPVTVNTVNPGFCHSEFGREGPFFEAIPRFFLARTTEVGSRTLYLSDCEIMEPSTYVRSEEGKKDQERVWRELMVKLESIKAGVTQGY